MLTGKAENLMLAGNSVKKEHTPGTYLSHG